MLAKRQLEKNWKRYENVRKVRISEIRKKQKKKSDSTENSEDRRLLGMTDARKLNLHRIANGM